jgi:ATP-binding cassette subfamily C protein
MSAGIPGEAFAEKARDLAQRLGAEHFTGLSGRVVELDDPETVWLVLAGRVDVQAVPRRGAEVAGLGQHLFEAAPNHLLPGTLPQPLEDGEAQSLALRGRCGAGTVLARTTRTRLLALSLDLDALVAIEHWVESLATAASPQPRALATGLLDADPGQALPAGAVLCAPHGSIVWAEVAEGLVHALGDAALPLRPGDPAWPLTETTWLSLPQASVLTGHLTPARMASGAIWGDVDAFGALVLRHLAGVQRDRGAASLDRQARRMAWTQRRFTEGLAALGRSVDERLSLPPEPVEAGDGWVAAFTVVAEACGIDTQGTALRDAGQHGGDLETAALAAGVVFRRVALNGEWWKRDHGPLLGFLKQVDAQGAQRAVALLPAGPGRYRMVEAPLAPGSAVTAAEAAALEPHALMLYRPMPARIRRLAEMLRFAARGTGPDLRTVLLMGLLTGLLGLLTPIASGWLMEAVLPRADYGLHIAVIGGLAAAALGVATFAVVQSIAVSRLQARIDLAGEAAVWNRLLRLRVRFFRGHATGDLANRALGISEIRRAVTGAATSSLLSGFFALLSGGLLFWYSTRLALIVLAFTIVVVLLQVGLFAMQLARQRQVAEAQGRNDALGFETLSAMTKLRAAAAEPRAFARWSAGFAALSRHRLSVARIDTLRNVLAGAIPLVGTGLLWIGAVGGTGEARESALGLGAFVAFQSAFGNFLGGILNLVRAGEALFGVAPLWERMRPILDAEPETGIGREPPGILRGALTLSQVSFRYAPDQPPALDGINLTIAAGEYVALVGPSGSGKSTLVRLLLGLEQPDSGAVYVDGMDLATLDLMAMRQQIGVVLQGGQVTAGSILENILGAAPLPEEAAWEAARQAGIAQDIRDMPMRMQTVVSERGEGLSGGQRQRLLIARALVRRPRILIFDEATSALDNATQSAVKETLDQLNITRVVVAHRLSTIRDVHRIVVLQEGRIVESGGHDALIAAGGMFAQLAARQLA